MDTKAVRIAAVASNARNAWGYSRTGAADLARHFARCAYSTAAEYGLFSLWAEDIARMEKSGRIKRGCEACLEFYHSADPINVFAPAHTATSHCRSGKRNHCTCDGCF